MSWNNNNLILKNEMESSYLIQRLHKPAQWQIKGKTFDNPFSFGGGLKNGGLSDNAMGLIRGIFSFDYMGSAEFEFGAVPTALKFIAVQAVQSNIINSKVELNKNETVYYLCPLEYESEVVNRIKQLRIDEYKYSLKEHCGLKDYFDGSYGRPPRKDNCGWLELDNGYMFFTDKEMYDKTCQLFGIKA
jgi:hypothetical protein